MKKPFSNNLTPAEAERLAFLIEEMSEATQAACKVLRHGYKSRHPDGGPDNRETLEEELGHVLHAMTLLCDGDDLSIYEINLSAAEKSESVKRWMHHQDWKNL